MGKRVRVNNKTDFAIVGILKDIPVNTDRSEEIYVSYSDIRDASPRLASDSSWGSVYSQSMCFLRLRPGVTVAQANDALLQMGRKYNKGRDKQTTLYRLQPLADIHFNGLFDGVADKKYLWSL